MNILLITLDQFRGDCLSALGHKFARTPNLDALASEGLLLARHYSQSAPCSPGRASLYTGMYPMNHRVVANGTPLDARFDNIAHLARRAGYAPTLFGYTDQSIDPRQADGPNDPRLSTYEGILPGFEEGVHLRGGAPHQWIGWLRERGFDAPDDADLVIAGESQRPEDASMTAFLNAQLLAWIENRHGPWFAHLSHYRPHPPYAAAGRFARTHDPAAMDQSIAAHPLHPLHETLMASRLMRVAPEEIAPMRAQYFGMIGEVDFQLGLLFAALRRLGQWDDTMIVVTSDHGEQLGDHGLKQKGGYFEESYRILGIVRDPRPGKARGRILRRFTENVDLLPTLAEALGQTIPVQCDGLALTPFLDAARDPATVPWRQAAHWQFDWRAPFIARNGGRDAPHWPDRTLETQNLSVRRCETHAFVHFADGASLCFDLAADPSWRTLERAPEKILACANALLAWRAQHQDRTLTGMLVREGGIGRWPEAAAGI